MTLPPDEVRRFLAVLDATPSTGIVELAKRAGLSPMRAFRWAVLRGAHFTKDDALSGYDFTGADFMGSDVTGADFRETTGLEKAHLSGVLSDPTTRWPANFRPIGSLIFIPAGRFLMGTTRAERRWENFPENSWGESESPRHEVRIARGFYLGRYPVTVGEFRRFVTETNHPISGQAYGWNAEKADFEFSERYDWANPGFPQTDRHPVTCVSHEDATEYAAWLSERTRQHYRLPTEAEWEYACRAGTKIARFWGDNREGAAEYANGADQSLAVSRKQDPNDKERFFQHDDGFPFTSPVGVFRPNPFGLYDMLGNVWEWCRDHYAQNYKSTPRDGTEFTTSDSDATRVLRGGAWIDNPALLRAGSRDGDVPRVRNSFTGFRVARALVPLKS